MSVQILLSYTIFDEKSAVENQCRRDEIKAPNDFVYHALDGDISEAYRMIEEQIQGRRR